MKTLQWNRSFSITEDAATAEDKAILLDFYNPDSIVCRQMECDTYSQKKVIHFVSVHLEPFRFNYGDEPYFKNYNITWMPTQVYLDKYGRENHRSIGFLGRMNSAPWPAGSGKNIFQQWEFCRRPISFR